MLVRFACVLALVAGLFPLAATAQSGPPPAEDDPAQVETFDAPVPEAPTNKSLVPSFQRRSGTAAGGPANELNTGDQRAREKLPGGNVAEAVTGADLYHGNFCGYGNRGDDATPTDELDAACKRHDECFDRTNRSCSCNEALRTDAYRVAELRSAPRELRARAASVIEAIPAMQCRNP